MTQEDIALGKQANLLGQFPCIWSASVTNGGKALQEVATHEDGWAVSHRIQYFWHLELEPKQEQYIVCKGNG